MARGILDSRPSFRRGHRVGSENGRSGSSQDDDRLGSEHGSNNDDAAADDDEEDDDEPSLGVLAFSFVLVFGSIGALCVGASKISSRISASTFDLSFDEFGFPVRQEDSQSFSFDTDALLSFFRSPKSLKTQLSTNFRRIPFESLPSKFPEQSSRLWKTVEVVVESLQDSSLGVITLLGSQENGKTREKLARVVGKSIADLAFDDPCPIIEVSAKELSKEKFDLVRRSFLDLLLASPKYIVIVYDLNILSSEAALMIYPFIDEARAPCKKCVFIFTITTSRLPKANQLQSHAEAILDEAWNEMTDVGSRMEVLSKFTPNCVLVR